MDQVNTVTLGIDQSYTSTAVFALRSGNLLSHQVFRSKADGKTPQHYLYRARDIADALAEYAISVQPARIGLEGLGFGAKGDQTRNLAGLQFLIMDRLEQAVHDGLLPADTKLEIIAPTSLKKFATDSGRADKDAMVDAVLKHDPKLHTFLLETPKTKGRYDIADAFFLAKYVADQMYGEFTLEEKQQMFVDGVW